MNIKEKREFKLEISINNFIQFLDIYGKGVWSNRLFKPVSG